MPEPGVVTKNAPPCVHGGRASRAGTREESVTGPINLADDIVVIQGGPDEGRTGRTARAGVSGRLRHGRLRINLINRLTCAHGGACQVARRLRWAQRCTNPAAPPGRSSVPRPVLPRPAPTS